MEFKNPYYKNRIKNFEQVFTENKFRISILISVFLGIVLMIVFQPVNYNFTFAIIFFSSIFFLSRLYGIIFRWLKLIPNEKSIIIDGARFIFTYPWPKKNIEISLSDIRYITFNKLSGKNAAIIEAKSYDQDLIDMEFDFEYHSVNSLSENDWIHFANQNELELIFTYDLDLRGKKDYYIIQKEDNENIRISKQELQQLLSQRTDIKLLGIQEHIHSLKQKDAEPMEQYSLDTQYSKESFDFVEGKIVISYSKGHFPQEIDRLTKSMGWIYKKQ